MSHYKPPELFPLLGAKQTHEQRRQYIQDVLVALAREGKLFLTDVLTQDRYVADLCVAILHGHYVDDDGFCQRGGDVPDELATYKVQLEKLPSGRLTYKLGGRKVPHNPRRERSANKVTYVWEDIIVDHGDAERVTVSAREAAIALRYSGEHVRWIRRTSAQERYWMFREVRPEGKKVKSGTAEK